MLEQLMIDQDLFNCFLNKFLQQCWVAGPRARGHSSALWLCLMLIDTDLAKVALLSFKGPVPHPRSNEINTVWMQPWPLQFPPPMSLEVDSRCCFLLKPMCRLEETGGRLEETGGRSFVEGQQAWEAALTGAWHFSYFGHSSVLI